MPLQADRANLTLYAAAQSIGTTAPADPVVPVASLSGPTSVGLCAEGLLDGSGSSGSGGRDLKYRWSLEATSSAAWGEANDGSEALVNDDAALALLDDEASHR